MQSLRVLKIDVDGSNYVEVLKSAEKTMARFQPYLLLEIMGNDKNDEKNRMIIEALTVVGYKAYHLNNLTYAIHSEDVLKTLPFGYNLLFMPTSKKRESEKAPFSLEEHTSEVLF